MILGVGLDICPIDRIGDILKRQGDAFETRVYTETERRYADCAVKNDRLAARWAAKEAFIKALGGAEGIGWLDIEVSNLESGAPVLTLKGEAKKQCDKTGVKNIHLSMSHAGGQAVAVVILES